MSPIKACVALITLLAASTFAISQEVTDQARAAATPVAEEAPAAATPAAEPARATSSLPLRTPPRRQGRRRRQAHRP